MLLGNLGAAPELKQTHGGAVLKLRLATSEQYIDKNQQRQERTEWHNVVIFGKRAEGLGRVLEKGSRLFVEGAIRSSTYEREGQKQTRYEIVANDVALQGGPRRPEGPPPQASSSSSSDDDLPF